MAARDIGLLLRGARFNKYLPQTWAFDQNENFDPVGLDPEDAGAGCGDCALTRGAGAAWV